MKKKIFKFTLECSANNGPDFCSTNKSSLLIWKNDGILECFIANDDENGFECHPTLKSALYASDSQYSNEPIIHVPIIDYEVYYCY